MPPAEPHWAEGVARRHLERLGWPVLAANYALRGGELDLVARDGDTVVFVEVRQRRSARYGHPGETLDARKLARLRRSALHWLRTVLGDVDARARFDAVLVLGSRERHTVEHLRDVM